MPGSSATKEYVTLLRLHNAHPIPVTLYLEPWGEQYILTPEATFTVVARGPEGDALEVEWADVISFCTDGQDQSSPSFMTAKK